MGDRQIIGFGKRRQQLCENILSGPTQPFIVKSDSSTSPALTRLQAASIRCSREWTKGHVSIGTWCRVCSAIARMLITWGADKLLALARSCPGTALMSNQWRSFSVVTSRTVGPGRSSRFIQRRRSISCGSSLCAPMGSDFRNRCSPLVLRMRETSAPDSPTDCRSMGDALNVWDHWAGMYILSLTKMMADLRLSELTLPFNRSIQEFRT